MKKYIPFLIFLVSCESCSETVQEYEKYVDDQVPAIQYTSPTEDELEITYFHASSVLGHLNSAQLTNVSIILEVAKEENFDKFLMLAIAFKESSFYSNVASHTGDYGLFQINARWWYKKLGYKTKKEFVKSNMDPRTSAKHAVFILRDFYRFKACQGDNIFACYNGGPKWRHSKARKVIERYQRSSIRIMRLIRERYDEWIFERSP